MKPFPLTPQILAVAANVIWFESAQQALADPVRFMAYAMTYALPEDMRVIRKYVSDDDFREALEHAPPGIIDPRSWAYWHSKMGRYPAPPMPTRRFGGGVSDTNTVAEGRPRSSQTDSVRRLDTLRKNAVESWKQMRAQGPTPDSEELRRRAAAEWRDKFGPGKKP